MAAADRPLPSTLTGVFTAGSPPLTETLRTLVVSPRRAVTPGETIRVEFAFSNLGGAAATNVRVRIAVPSGVAHVEGSDTVDDAPAGDRLDTVEGARLGDLPPNAQRRVACSFRVNDRVEDGAILLFQAALATDQTPIVASNVERLTVRSRPVLESDATFLTVTPTEEARPGSAIIVRATIANTGASSAHDVLAMFPLPPYTQYVPRTARIAGRVLLNVRDEPFDYASSTIVAEQLAPGQSVVVEYHATIDSPLPDGTRLRVSGAVSSREVAEFALESADVVVSSPPDFSTPETALTVFCDDVVSPGTRVPMAVRAMNAGTGDAQNVSISFELPPGLAYTPGSAHVDGQSVSDESYAGSAFSLGTLPSGRAVDVGISAIVTQHAADLPIGAVLQWKGPDSAGAPGQRRFSRSLQLRVSSRFTRARNFIEVDRGVVAAREDVTFVVHVFNDGTAPESDVRLRLIPGAFLDNVRVAEALDEPIAYTQPFALGLVQPHAERTFVVHARVASPVPDRSHVTLGAVLEFPNGSYDVGSATVVVRSRPHVSLAACTWERVQHDPIRPGQTHELVIRFTNDGADLLRDARMDLVVPPELVLDRALNARRDGTSALLFGDVPAETTHEARIAVRLLRAPRREAVLTIEGTLTGRGISPVQFEPLEVQTFAQPEFAQSAQLRSNPAHSIDAGERVAYDLVLRNNGDGPAEHVSLRAVPSNLAVYVPASTVLNGMTIPDDLGASQLWSQRGLMLTDVNPGIDLHVRWEMLVISPLAAGTAIETRMVVEWDQNQSLALAAPPLIVQSGPALAAGSAGTPISVAQLVPPLETPAQETIVPPAAPAPFATEQVPEPEEPAELQIPAEAQEVQEVHEAAPAPVSPPEPAAPAPEPPRSPLIAEAPPALEVLEAPDRSAQVEAHARARVLYVDYSEDQLAQAIRALERTDGGGLLPHVFAVRALFPNAIAGGDAADEDAMQHAARSMRAPLDRFFVRLRMPRLTVSAKDLEDRESREGLRELLRAVETPAAAELTARPAGIVRLSGIVPLDEIRPFAAQLETAPLGSIVPWQINARLIGTRLEYNDGSQSDVVGQYRAELVKVFDVLGTLPAPEFHRVLGSSVNRLLDDALTAVLDALRAAAHVAVE